jgi:CRISPR-associated protein Cas2
MMILITYDVDMTNDSGAKRLRKVAKICENYGIRVQNSVFELLIDLAQLVAIKAQLASVIDADKDSIRFYSMGNNWKNKIDFIGRPSRINQGQTLIL